jgi:hypothetical protein
MEYKVLASLRDEMNQGWVWATNSGLDPRSVVKIKNLKNNKCIFCECLEIEENYKKAYNAPPREHIKDTEITITINAWYRKKLGGIETKTDHELEIRAANGLWGKLRANIQHPQVVVRMATWLAIISIGLGLLSICLSIKT